MIISSLATERNYNALLDPPLHDAVPGMDTGVPIRLCRLCVRERQTRTGRATCRALPCQFTFLLRCVCWGCGNHCLWRLAHGGISPVITSTKSTHESGPFKHSVARPLYAKYSRAVACGGARGATAPPGISSFCGFLN